jgi:hypothetical protein
MSVQRLEEIHETGGACERNRCDLWNAINDLREKISSMRIQLTLILSAFTFVSTFLANLAFWYITKK